ncbi:TonB-dependent receptor [Pseudomonas protegens]|uniref:TonB-dependent receptor n=1 Tax=Pseudomonas protegens TaxID=380021 RepID=A0A7G7XC66_9PSED|nr:TonB-dependent receptor [Pseudomonas protegens]QNH77561.1 TonB-dependent receptor [Pseudomonas protegens]QNL06757.1 TonB-dependent receptor [Pseudomonas protegens]
MRLHSIRGGRRMLLPMFTLSVTALLPHTALACASCGCTLSSDWDNLGISNSSGLKLDLRYDYLNQNQLRSGSSTISPRTASQINNQGQAQEVEKYTRNDYLTLGLDYSINRDWGVNLQMPYIFRSHSTLGTASDGVSAGDGGGQYSSKTSSLGDVKIIGRYQGFTPQHNFGLLFGVKLPTGSHDDTASSSDPSTPGPVPIDRGLQPGTGTTDAILGAYYMDSLNKNWDYFGQAMVQRAMDSSDQYRPGDGINLNAGLRYMGNAYVMPQLQVNVRHVERDQGAQADTVSTGGTLAYLSPGVTIPVTAKASLYSFVQVPVYQNVNGVQLAPRYTATVGARYAF